ncbi:tetratricopeptide repeat protein [Salinisphaera aquimarina]|uniref:Tetratricopeptide repeat protein n=1 Tax=Salinisphaera aquimarina TaxID=2094031 RepID=A0ABV7ESC3_9GAMM
MADNKAEAKRHKPQQRSRLVRPLTLLIITGVLVIALILLFPARRFASLSQKPQSKEDPSSISITYLQALLKAKPEDQELRLNLAEQQLKAGQVAAANRTLEPLPDSENADIRWLRFEAAWQAYNNAPEDGPARAERRDELESRMRAIGGVEAEEEEEESTERPVISSERLKILAERWLQLGEPARAATDYERLAAQDRDHAYSWYALAGRWWLAADKPQRSAQAWRAAFENTDDAKRRRDAALSALDAARQQNQGGALALAGEFIEAYPDDPTFLDIGIELALADNRMERAQHWSKQYLALRPDDDAGLERDTRIALAMNRLGEALTGLEQLVERNPDNRELRAKLAQVQIWAGQPQAALANYERLARGASSDEYDNQIIDLAADLHDTNAVLDALNRIRQRHPLDASQQTLLVDILNSEGDPDRAIAVIGSWVRGGSADRDLWVRMATLQELTGDTEGSLASWTDIASRYGRSVEETQARGRLLARQWRMEDALAVMRSLPNKPGTDRESDVFYWSTMGELAWNLNDPAATRDAYYPLYEAGKLDDNGYLRLAQTAVETGRMDMAMEVARRDWRENRHVDMIIQMLGAAQRENRPDLSEALLAMAATRPSLFADSADYWQLYGDYHFAQRDLDEARIAYLRALAIAPGDVGNRSALMYTLAESGRLDELRRYVKAWRGDAWRDPRQWQVFAMAYSRLGDTRRALPWFDRAVHADPDNYLLVLDYADALERGRRFDSARRMRRYAVVELRPRLMRDLNAKGLLTREQRDQDARILGVQAAMLGPDANRGWLRTALDGRRDRALTGPDVEMLFGYYLSLEQPAYARYWLLQSQRRRLATEDWQEMAVALQSNDQVAMQRLLEGSRPGGDIGIADRISALRQLDLRARALTLALDHERPDEPYVTGIDVVPRYAAELYQEMPQYYGSQLLVRRISDLDITGESVFFRLSGEKLSTRVELGARQFSDQGIDVDLDGLDNERFANIELNWRERRGVSTVRVGTVSTDDKDLLQLGLGQSWQITDHVAGSVFANYNTLADETGQLRILGVRDELGTTLEWVLNPRDSVSLAATYSRFYSREDRNFLGDGYQLEGTVAHSLMVGPTHQIQVRVFANTEQNFLEDDLPADMAARLPAGTNLNDVVPAKYSFIGAGLSFARGIPGEEYPVVASPRYRLDLDTGYVLPDNQIGVSANFAIGSRLFGSDEISLNFGVDQSGSDSRQNSYTGLLKYQYFLGR